MHTKQLDFFFFHSPIKGKILLTSWKKLGTHKYYHYTGVKMGTKREKKKSSLDFCLCCCQPISVKMNR